MPKLPRYLKKDGRYPWFIKNNVSYIKDGILHFQVKRLHGVTFTTKSQGRLIQVRFIPRGSCYVMEIVTEVQIINCERESKRIASIDLGVNNFVTLTNNIGLQPIIINGKGIKSINQFYNKQKAKLVSDLTKRNNKYWSKNLDKISFKRNMRVKSFIHNVSRKVVNYCLENNLDTLICGYNKKWKQECSMSKTSNQKFVYIPYDMLLSQLIYKCQDVGIKFITTDESYTSGTSFLDGEVACKENYDKSRRITRGLFQTYSKGLINADVNGSLQIMRKVFPNATYGGYGIEGFDLTPIVINVA
jgi:putative transposase